jgi:hypothetical protein
MNSTHTPGPWHHDGEFIYAKNPTIRIADTTIAIADEDRLSEDTADANAALIAVAPDMETLLQEALDYEADAFNNDQPVNGADLVDWFAEWRQRAAATLRHKDCVKL